MEPGCKCGGENGFHTSNNKNINLVFAQNDRMAVGAYLSARQRQLEKMLFVGIDALPGKGYGVEQVTGRCWMLLLLFIRTGGDKVIQVAMDILEKRPYERDTKLSTALLIKRMPSG